LNSFRGEKRTRIGRWVGKGRTGQKNARAISVGGYICSHNWNAWPGQWGVDWNRMGCRQSGTLRIRQPVAGWKNQIKDFSRNFDFFVAAEQTSFCKRGALATIGQTVSRISGTIPCFACIR
jgi:hypothetical protein